MHKDHPAFNPPKDENAKIWRYIDFTKFVSIIDTCVLFFANIESLDDKFEGSLPKYLFEPYLEENASKEHQKRIKNLKAKQSEAMPWFKKCFFVNCWHLNDYESAAMWKLYLKSDEGVAIQSTYRRFANCFNEYVSNDVFIGLVNYIDYNKNTIPSNNALFPFLYKRKSFEHEKELRAAIFDKSYILSGLNNKSEVENYCEPLYGLDVCVNLDTLIEKVYVSPTAQNWFEDLVRSVMKKYGCNKPVIKSSLADDPLL